MRTRPRSRTKLPGLGNSRYYDAVTLCAIVSQLRLLSGAAACAAQHLLAHPEDEGGAQAAGLRNRAESRNGCGRGAPSPGTDVAVVGRVPAQMWQGSGRSRAGAALMPVAVKSV